jgi:uncharacterized protein YfaP (DUF2135 family)
LTRFALAAATLVVLLSVAGVAAQSLDLGDAPVAIDGWRSIKGPNDQHIYVCDHPDCAPHSKVSVLLYAGSAITPGQLRRQREAVAELPQERSARCTFAHRALVPGAPTPMRCVATAPDGSKSYDTGGIISGPNLSASLMSSSRDETASEANYVQFEAALKAVVNSGLPAKR